MSKIHIHVHTKDASPEQIQRAKRVAGTALVTAQGSCRELKNLLTDRDDKAQVDSALSFIRDALGKLTEVQER